MNTSANTNHSTTRTARAARIEFLRRSMAGALLASAIGATALGLATTSHADAEVPRFGGEAPVGTNCQTDMWGFLGSQRRTLCDGPISGYGSWSRHRTIWMPAHRTSYYCTNRSDWYRDCSGG